MHLLIVIPARIGSARLPEKPLRLLGGEPLIRVVTRNVLDWGFGAPVVVATDDARVAAAVAPLGAEALLTRVDHPTGTDRVAEVASRPPYSGAAVVLNVQGDQPFAGRDVAEAALARIAAGDPLATAAAPLAREAVTDRHRVKVVVDRASSRALRFAREVPGSAAWPCGVDVLEHVGVYAYTAAALRRWAALEAAPEERREGLEQLRPLAHGLPIGVGRAAGPAPLGIDTAADLARAEELLTAAGRGGF